MTMTRIEFRDSAGRPVAGAVVAITAAPADMIDLGYITDDQGSIALTLPAGGEYCFTLTDAAGLRLSGGGVLQDGGTVDLLVRPAP
jgi:hypothetical protein